MKSVEVVLMTRPGCHLCEVARRVIEEVLEQEGWTRRVKLRAENICADPSWEDLYRLDIPVIFIAGVRSFSWRVHPERLRTLLRIQLQEEP